MTIIIRSSCNTDVPAIHTAYSHAVVNGTASWELEPPNLEEMARRWTSVVDAGFPWLVAEENGTTLGYAYAAPYRPRAAYRATVEDSIYLDPAHTGRGIGRLLLQNLINRCEQDGFRQMVSVLGDGYKGSHASLKLHEAFGFEVVGIVKEIGFKHGRWLDQILMQRKLGEGAATEPNWG